jgi:RecB family exonuclease
MTLEQRIRKYRDHLLARMNNHHTLLDIADVINRLNSILQEPKLPDEVTKPTKR